MNKRKLKIYFQTKTDFLDDFLPKGSLCKVSLQWNRHRYLLLTVCCFCIERAPRYCLIGYLTPGNWYTTKIIQQGFGVYIPLKRFLRNAFELFSSHPFSVRCNFHHMLLCWFQTKKRNPDRADLKISDATLVSQRHW